MNTLTTATARTRRIADLPHPKGLPLIGNAHQLKPDRLHLILERWAEELGVPYRLQICGRPVVVTTDAELAQRMARERPHRYRRMRQLESVLEEIGCNGLFSAEGVAWEPNRRLVMQALSVPHIKAFFPTLNAITGRLRVRLARAASEGRTLDMTQELKRYTVDVTSALAFGEDPHTLEQERGVIQEHLALIMPMLMRRINAPFPYWRYVRLPQDRQVDRALVEIHRYVRRMMQRAREHMRDDPRETPRHLLEAMLTMCDAPGSSVTEDQIAANVLTLLLAGEDTTANALSWALFYVATDRALQQRLARHARRVLGESAVCPDFEWLKHFDLFEAVCTEAGRLRPVASISSFEPLEDVQLDNLFVPAGTTIFFVHRPAMLDPRHFANPERFDPDRWLHPRDAGGPHEPRACMLFGAGPRVCPGRYLAGVEMRLVLSMLLAGFEVELTVDPASIEEVTAFAMVPNVMPLRLRPRA
jgi:cytochrome P450